MRRIGFFMLGFVLLALGAVGPAFLAGSVLAAAGPNLATNADYSGVPPFVTSAVPPNVLILMDNSGSMGLRAYCGTPTLSGNDATCGGTFVATTTYAGMFNEMTCYTYDATNTRFSESLLTTKTAINTACGATEWDGNFLNFVSLRRFDAVKRAMIGGSCLAARAADGTCPPSGTPAQITLKAQKAFSSAACCLNGATPAVPNNPPGPDGTAGRVPDSVRTSSIMPANLRFVVRGLPTPLAGFFCVADAADLNIFPASSCQAAALGYTEQQFAIHVVVATEPLGVINELGDKGRFGLLEFKGNDGAKVLTPIGARQSVDFSSTSAVTYNTNKAAMLAGVEGSFPATNTPLGESLYEGIRYIAQVNSAFFPLSYVYPIAFSSSGGAPFGPAGAGSLGPAEITALTGTETCPAGYITSACGRDPFFFGSNHSPAWASPSRIVTCCKTFIIVFTDGEPTQDFTSHANLQDIAHSSHGVHCTGGSTTIHAPNGTCNTNTATPPATLLGEHKTDYLTAVHHLDDVAYWGHTNDLRQATVPVINEPGHDLPGFQNVTVYSFFAFGNIIGREILMQAARQGGFEDSNGNNQPDLQSEYDRVNNDTGLLVPDGIPDTYFESQNVDDLREKLLSAITSILQRAASGTSVSVLATSSTGEGAIYQAFFFPTTFVTIGGNTNQVLWTGFAQGLFIDKFGNLREDYSSATTIPSTSCTGAPDGKLVLTHDCIIKIRLDTDTTSPTFGQVLIDRFADDGLTGGCASVLPTPTCTAGDGVADTTTPLLTVTLTTGGVSNAQPMWEAGRQLALLDSGSSCESSSTWPIAGNMTQSGRTCRRIITWADLSNGGGVGGGAGTETLEVSTANVAALCPYLGAATVLHCNSTNTAAINAAAITADPSLAGCTGLTRQTCARNEATNIINFTRGFNVSGYRDRTFNVIDTGGSQVQKVWKLSDIIHSTPIVVGAPKERFDVIYGDATYASYFQRYKDRRQVAYVGANDGMLHAFNAGFFRAEDSKIDGTGPNVQVRFTTTPKQAGSSTNCAALPCDAAVTTYSFRSDAPPLGSELWGFIPQDLLPQLRWMTGANYDHIYYVDLKPKVTDVRTFTADADHPGGWGTVLIGGFRLGGSCTNCAGSKGTARVVNSDFNGDGDTTDSTSGSTAGSDYRVFLSSYFVLDITNPEKEPALLWTFRDQNLGLTTAAPAVLRVNPSADAKTSGTNEKWYVVFGSGPTHHDAFSQQTAQLYIVDLKAGPSYTNINKTNGSGCTTAAPCITVNTAASSGAVRAFSTGATGSFMGDVVTLDSNLDYRVDTVYAGYTLCNGSTTSTGCGGSGPMWKGAMWRLTTNGGNTDPDTWGASTGCGTTVCPTKLLSTFAYTTTQATTCTSASPCNVGPVTSSAALTSDDSNNIWVLFGTGRFFSSTDKSNVDIQHYFGVKDSFITSGSPAQTTERNNLFNSSNIIVCSNCSAGGNVSTTGSTTSFTTSFDQGSSSLLAQVLNTDGWFTTFSNPPNPLTPGERNLTASGPLVGGTLFFTTFTPVADICTASGTGLLYAVFYQTGGPYKESALGTTASGSNLLVNKSVSLGQGMPSQAAIQIGAQGTGTSGASSSAGCAGRTTVYIQSSTGVLGQNCGKTALSSWSRMVSWRDL